MIERRRSPVMRPWVVILIVAALGVASDARASETTIRFIPQADLRVIDPIFPSYVTRNYGYMVYDTLFGMDDQFRPQPQMVKDFTLSPDKLTYTFTLRDGLKWHDGERVRAADCVASLQRWMKRDGLGQAIAEQVGDIKSLSDDQFIIVLKRPFPFLIDGLAKLSSVPAFMMPERIAKTDPNTRITDSIGSGPFRFLKDQWQPGVKAVFEKFADYLPRKEPPVWTAGGKVAKVDRIEWDYVPDSTTAANAINAGEEDWWEQVPVDILPVLASNKDVTIAVTDPLGNGGNMRFNHLQPPFNDERMRQALLYALDQKVLMQAAVGDSKYWQTCYSVYPCGTPLASDAGAEWAARAGDLDRAKALIKQANYTGERIVVLDATDQPIPHSLALVVAETMKQLGLNVDLQSIDFSTLLTRRASKEPVDNRGWSVYFSVLASPDFLNPANNNLLRANGAKGWFGWPSDEKLEELRAQWIDTSDPATQKKIAQEIQIEAFKNVPYVPTGQFVVPTAFHKPVRNILTAPISLFWNVEKPQ